MKRSDRFLFQEEKAKLFDEMVDNIIEAQNADFSKEEEKQFFNKSAKHGYKNMRLLIKAGVIETGLISQQMSVYDV